MESTLIRNEEEISGIMSNFTSTGKKDTRSGFGVGLHELGKKNDQVIAMCADLSGSLKMNDFMAEFPERYYSAGIAEANMIGVAAGLATAGKLPFIGTFANFATGRVYDQIRQSVAYSKKNVKICASHAGLTLGEDGATHQILEDISLMKGLPNMTVVVPCDYNQTRLATLAIAEIKGPCYLRFGRPKWDIFTPAEDPSFEIGKAQLLLSGSDVTIFACGHMVWYSLKAAEALASEGISAEVINIHTIKPFDSEAVIASAKRTGCVVTAEEHMRNGGLGDSVAQTLGMHLPTPQEYVAVNDTFGESGKPEELLVKYGLDVSDIVAAAKRSIARK